MATFVENWSNALVQGSLAGGVLYWHGCRLAADVLALNREHRQSRAFSRTVLDGARRMAAQAGEILRVATRQLRAMYRERRMNVLKTVASKDTPFVAHIAGSSSHATCCTHQHHSLNVARIAPFARSG